MGGQFGWGAQEEGWRKGPWTAQEDKVLIDHIGFHGEGRWNSVSRLTGLKRSGKSCRLRWVNYLSPDLKRGKITPLEEGIIIELHARWGNRWSTIARSLPGRTDNEIKNYWRTHFKKGKPSKNKERAAKAAARFLLQQQQQQQEEEENDDQHKEDQHHPQLPVLQEQQEKPQQVLQLEGDYNYNYSHNYGAISLAQELQEMGYFMCPTISSIFHGGDHELAAAVPDQQYYSSEEGNWGCLWNLDDVHPADMHETNLHCLQGHITTSY